MNKREKLENISKKVVDLTDDNGIFIGEVKMDDDIYAALYRQAEQAVKMQTQNSELRVFLKEVCKVEDWGTDEIYLAMDFIQWQLKQMEYLKGSINRFKEQIKTLEEKNG